MIGTLRKLYNRKRAISPVISAILLIGLAVAAGAILIVVVLPLLTPAPNVTVSETVGIDRNADGLVDKLTVKLTNQGTAADVISSVTAADFSAWTTNAANLEIPVSTTSLTEVTWTCTSVIDQKAASLSWTITLTLQSGKVLEAKTTDTSTDITVTTLGEASMLIDFTSASGKVAGFPTSGVIITQASADATHIDKAGVKMVATSYSGLVGYVTIGATITTASDLEAYANQLSSTIFDSNAKPYLEFWIKGTSTENSVAVELTVYDGTTAYENVSQVLSIGNSWTPIRLDLSSTTGWTTENSHTDWTTKQYMGGFRLHFGATTATTNTIYLDDVGVFAGF